MAIDAIELLEANLLLLSWSWHWYGVLSKYHECEIWAGSIPATFPNFAVSFQVDITVERNFSSVQ